MFLLSARSVFANVPSMGGRTRIEERLVLFRREFPRHVSWAEVRAEDPTVFRNAVLGGLLVVPAVGATVGLSGLMLEIPAPVVLPPWIDWARGLLLVVLMFVTIGLWLIAGIAVSLPADVRRQLALTAFGRERGLLFSRMGLAPTPGGVLLAGGDEWARPSRVRVDSTKAAYRAEFALWRPEPTGRRSLQIAIARHSGDRSSPQGPRHSFRYLETLLPREVPHIVIDARRNGRLRSILPETQRLSLEGDFDRFFTVYVPNGYERDALQLLTPDVMVCLIDHGRAWDIEIFDDRLIIASRRFGRGSDRSECTALLAFSELIVEELGRQARHYTDPRSGSPRTAVAEAGRRLRRRSAARGVAAAVAIGTAFFAFPWVLGWFLDR